MTRDQHAELMRRYDAGWSLAHIHQRLVSVGWREIGDALHPVWSARGFRGKAAAPKAADARDAIEVPA